MINQIKNIFNTILNKEGRGELTPTEFDGLVQTVQIDIFSGYLEEYKKAVRQNNRGLGAINLANAKLAISSKINPFRFFTRSVDLDDNKFTLTSDIAFVDAITIDNFPVNILEDNFHRVVLSDRAKPTKEFPVAVFDEGKYLISPDYENEKAIISGIRFPKTPKWTFREIGGAAIYNPSASDFQDIELHHSELPSMVWGLCSLMGIRLKEAEVVQIMESFKDKDFQKENFL